MRIIAAILLLIVMMGCNDDSGTDPGSLVGKGGSMARFALTPTHLYVVNDESLIVYQISQNGSLTKLNTSIIGKGVETIFVKDQFLYIGTNDAMLTYDLTHPAVPDYVSRYTHIVACDPVVVQDTLAFVTIRTSGCRSGSFNALDIINIKDPVAPTLVSSYPLDSPFGLGVDGNLLFVCEGEHGLKIFDISNPLSIVLITAFTEMNAYDVIPNNGVLIVTGKDGVLQYDYSDPLSIKRLSTISLADEN